MLKKSCPFLFCESLYENGQVSWTYSTLVLLIPESYTITKLTGSLEEAGGFGDFTKSTRGSTAGSYSIKLTGNIFIVVFNVSIALVPTI